MLVVVVGVIEHDHGEIGGIAEGAADGESGGGGRVNARSGGERVEPAKIDSPVRLKFVESFGHSGFSSLRSDSATMGHNFRCAQNAKRTTDSDVYRAVSVTCGLSKKS